MSYFRMPHFDWLEGSGLKCSPFGREVAYIVGCTFGGIYNAPIAHEKTNWQNDKFMNIVVPQRGLATFDFNPLTRLVLFAHEMCIRVDVEPIARFYEWSEAEEQSHHVGTVERSDDVPRGADYCEPCLRIWFHKRRGRDGCAGARHPTIETAIEDFRAAYKHPDQIVQDLAREPV